MKFNRLLVYISLLLMISNIILTKKSQLKSKDKDDSEDAHEQEYREDVVFKTEINHYDDDDMDEEVREEEVHEKAEEDINTVLLETKSTTKNESHAHAELKNHVANKLNRIIKKNKTMLNEGNLLQKRTNNLLSGIKKNLR